MDDLGLVRAAAQDVAAARLLLRQRQDAFVAISARRNQRNGYRLRHGTRGTRNRIAGGTAPHRPLTAHAPPSDQPPAVGDKSVNVSTPLVHICHTNTLKGLAHPVDSRRSA